MDNVFLLQTKSTQRFVSSSVVLGKNRAQHQEMLEKQAMFSKQNYLYKQLEKSESSDRTITQRKLKTTKQDDNTKSTKLLT